MSGSSGKRPLIGICCACESARWLSWELPADLLPRMYSASVQRAGGAAVLLPVDAGWSDDPDCVIEQLDGLLLAGGADVDPASYGAEPHPETSDFSLQRDAGEIALFKRATERDLPVLGICRGMQVINVAAGGTLIQHVPERFEGLHRGQSGSFEGADHEVTLTPDSKVAHAVGAQRLTVNSHHHQAVDRLGDGLVVTGRASADELPEALELPGNDFAIAVQWHPEALEADRLIPALCEVAARDVK